MIVPCRILGRHLIAVSLAAGIAGGTSSLASMPLAVNSDSVGSFGDITRFSTDVRFNSGSIQPRVLVDMNKVVRRAKIPLVIRQDFHPIPKPAGIGLGRQRSRQV